MESLCRTKYFSVQLLQMRDALSVRGPSKRKRESKDAQLRPVIQAKDFQIYFYRIAAVRLKTGLPGRKGFTEKRKT